MTDTTVRIGLTADGAKAKAGISAVEASLGRLNASVRHASHYGAGLAVALGVDVPNRLLGLGRSVVDAADQMTLMSSRLQLVTGGAQAAAAVQGQLFDIARTSRVPFGELADTYTRLARAAQPLGIGQERLLAVVTSISQAMALSGGSAQGLQAALVQLGQGLASGVLRGEELNSILEQAPRLAQAMADGLGVPLGQLRALGAAGRLTTSQLIEALERAGPQLAAQQYVLEIHAMLTALTALPACPTASAIADAVWSKDLP